MSAGVSAGALHAAEFLICLGSLALSSSLRMKVPCLHMHAKGISSMVIAFHRDGHFNGRVSSAWMLLSLPLFCFALDNL